VAHHSGVVSPPGDRSARFSDQAPVNPTPAVLRTCEEAEAYVASVCFKHGPPSLVGVELEWLVHRRDQPAAWPDPAALAAALGSHAPTTLVLASPAAPLPHGSLVTVEPGGQVELASIPAPDLGTLLSTVRADSAELHRLLAAEGLYPIAEAADPVRPPRRILDAPRYVAMEQCFDRIGSGGRSGMCSTAAVQVCLDAGEAVDVAARWAALHALGPVLVAAFANSPRLHGRSTGWKSTRMACWLALDPWRTAPPVSLDADPAAAWARRAMHTQLLCVRRDGAAWDAPAGMTFADWVRGALQVPPTTDDLDYHLSTLFPPVRPHGHLEVRYIDAQRGPDWELPLTLLASLLANLSTVDAALAACAPAIGRWTAAARFGLADRTLARCAATVFDLACAGLPAVGAPQEVVARLEEMTERYVLRGRCPADDEPAAAVHDLALHAPLGVSEVPR